MKVTKVKNGVAGKTEVLTLEEYHAKYYGKKVKAPQQSESSLQRNCVKWFDFKYMNKYTWIITTKKKVKKQIKIVNQRVSLLMKLNNEGGSSAINKHNAKLEGLSIGASDMLLAVPQFDISLNAVPGLFIEFKIATGKQSFEQMEFQRAVELHGYKYTIIRTFESFEKEIKEYLK